ATFGASIAHPTVLAARTLADTDTVAAQRSETERVMDLFIAIEEKLERMNRRLTGRHEHAWQERARPGVDAPSPAGAAALADLDAALRDHRAELDRLQSAVTDHFEAAERLLIDGGQPASAVQRQHQLALDYEQRYAELSRRLEAIAGATNDEEYKTAVAVAHDFVEAHSSKPVRAAHDPERLAFGPPSKRARRPLADESALRSALGVGTKAIAASQAPGPADLAATEDVQLTPQILAKASALNRQPLPIFQWVRNNVAFSPTYGSIQGSDYVLKTLRGNAFDQASLLIALLRASNIHARYVYGTVEVPIAQVRNWVGNAATAEAALELLGQGGVPAVGIVEGGTITKVQMEHVWVEAWIDYVPSRGARHVTGDTWIPLDPSFKQFDHITAMKPTDALPFDAAAYLGVLQSTAESDEAAGWARLTNRAPARDFIDGYGEAWFDHIEAEASTTAQVFGRRSIRTQQSTYLPASLPHALVAVADRWAALPETLRWSFEYRLEGAALLSRGLPSLSGKQLAVSFKPASAQDAQTFRNYFPAEMNDLSDVPTVFPAGDVSLRPTLWIDGTAVAAGNAYGLGAPLHTALRMFRPGQGWSESANVLRTGEFQTLRVDAGEFASEDFDVLLAQAAEVQSRLDAGDVAGLETTHASAFPQYTTLLTYFAQTLHNAEAAAAWSDVLFYRLPSYGTVSSTASVTTWLGLPVSFEMKGVTVDIDHLQHAAVHRGNDIDATRAFNRVAGAMMSDFEHIALEQVFMRDAASAMKLLANAHLAGQRIFQIEAHNLEGALQAMSLPEHVEERMADHVLAGYRVTAHEAPLGSAETTSAGYIVLDPATGAGAYVLASGADGGYVEGGYLNREEAYLYGATLAVAFMWGVIGGAILLPPAGGWIA
ncbi:MAG TPA: transglutaminase-like domain-containing protein, partial [Vicinamibacterales bacterium]|nr:transglutaminase-like domain-containing protein [Vicinamibacterales bacterium]